MAVRTLSPARALAIYHTLCNATVSSTRRKDGSHPVVAQRVYIDKAKLAITAEGIVTTTEVVALGSQDWREDDFFSVVHDDVPDTDHASHQVQAISTIDDGIVLRYMTVLGSVDV